jgi:hypothetical protein
MLFAPHVASTSFDIPIHYCTAVQFAKQLLFEGQSVQADASLTNPLFLISIHGLSFDRIRTVAAQTTLAYPFLRAALGSKTLGVGLTRLNCLCLVRPSSQE